MKNEAFDTQVEKCLHTAQIQKQLVKSKSINKQYVSKHLDLHAIRGEFLPYQMKNVTANLSLVVIQDYFDSLSFEDRILVAAEDLCEATFVASLIKAHWTLSLNDIGNK